MNKLTIVGSVGLWWYVNRPTLVLSDGSMMNFSSADASCMGTDTGTIAPFAGHICGAVIVDVNGCKKPNTWGKDIFSIELLENKALPLGPSNNDDVRQKCTTSTANAFAGLWCGEYVIQDIDY